MSIEQNTNEVNFSEVNWNNLSKEEFRELEVHAQKLAREAKNNLKEINSTKDVKVCVEINGDKYLVSKYHAELLKNSRESIKQTNIESEIQRVYAPIEEL